MELVLVCTGFRNAAAQHHCFMDAFLGGGAGDLVGRAPYVFDAASVSVARVRRTRAWLCHVGECRRLEGSVG